MSKIKEWLLNENNLSQEAVEYRQSLDEMYKNFNNKLNEKNKCN